MYIRFEHKGNFDKTSNFLKNLQKKRFMDALERCAEEGTKALQEATPVDTGLTAASWYHRIDEKPDKVVITWSNSNVNDGVNIAFIIQYGHVTRNGGYVEGLDYINPAIRPVFEKLVSRTWEEVTKR